MLANVTHLEGTFNIHESALLMIAHPFNNPKTLGNLLVTARNTDIISSDETYKSNCFGFTIYAGIRIIKSDIFMHSE